MQRLLLTCLVLTASALPTSRALGVDDFGKALKRLPVTAEEAQRKSTLELPSDTRAPAMTPSNQIAPEQQQQAAPSPPQRLRANAPVISPFVEPALPSQTQQALSFYGGYSARSTLSQMPRRAPLQPAPSRPLHGPTKPFQNLNQEPTMSPYLGLDREEQVTDFPNYFTYVRPQQQQLQMNQIQQREIQQLRGQVQSMSAGPQQSAGPYGGRSARFMDTAQFYGSWR